MTDIDFNSIKSAVKRLDEFLTAHPELIELQQKINKELEKVGNNPQKRCRVLQELMLNKWYEVVDIWENKQ